MLGGSRSEFGFIFCFFLMPVGRLSREAVPYGHRVGEIGRKGRGREQKGEVGGKSKDLGWTTAQLKRKRIPLQTAKNR